MNLENIKEGTIFKNYKEMCVALGVPSKGGKSKEYHLVDLSRYLDYTKHGNNFIINSIRETPLDKMPRAYNPYGDLIQILILDLLARNGDNNNSIHLSTSKLLLYLNMVNEKYTYYRYHINRLHESTEIDTLHLLEWYNLAHSTLKSTLESALKTLNSKALIYWKYSMTLVSQNHEHYKANDEEIGFVLECEREVLTEFKCEDKHQVFQRGKWNKFIDKVNDMLYQEWGVEYYYNSYEIIYNRNKDTILDEKERMTYLLTQYERMEKQYSLNNIVINRLNENADRRVVKVSKKPKDEELNKTESIRIEQNYIDDDRILNNLLIKR